MVKVFGVGLSRTGTVSLTCALQQLGYKTKHYPPLFQVIQMAETFDALTDTPVIVFMEALDRLYPDAKFVLTVRDEKAWLNSCRRHYAKKPVERIMKWKLWNRRAVYGIHTFDADLFRQVRVAHTRRVKNCFRERPGKLLILNVCAGEGYEKLCPFLGKPMRAGEFPHENRG